MPEFVSRAFYEATNGRPGPVLLALPEDVLVERVAVPSAPVFEPVETWPGATDMMKLQKLLWAAHRPIVIVDEAHNARTDLSFTMLKRFAPACIIEFTATPDTKEHPSNILPIIGSTNPDHIREAVKATEVELTREEWYQLLKAARSEPLP